MQVQISLSPRFQEVFIRIKWDDLTVRIAARALTFQRRIILEVVQLTVVHARMVSDHRSERYKSIKVYLAFDLSPINNCFHLPRKYVRIFVRGNDLFRETNRFSRV